MEQPALKTETLVRRRATTDPDDTSNEIHDTKTTSKIQRLLIRELAKIESQSSMVRKAMDMVRTLPMSVRIIFLFLWLLWKVFVAFLMIRITLYNNRFPITGAAKDIESMSTTSSEQARNKILYIVTALAEYNSGYRSTIKGQDRLGEVLIPVLIDSVEAMLAPPYNYNVDVYLILGYTLKPERLLMIMNRLPEGVGLEVWDDATPLGYDAKKSGTTNQLVENTRTLARQHRYVIRDKLFMYDVFLALEDDMRFTGAHIQNFLDFSKELEQMMQKAPETLTDVPESTDPKNMKFFGEMTKDQMKRLIPGFVRVEVLVNETKWSAQKDLAPIDLDFEYNGEKHIDPSICCHVPNMRPNVEAPIYPLPNDVVIWETAVQGLSLRQLPNSEEWVVLLPGPGKKLAPQETIGGYWSGRNGEFGDIQRPGGGQPDLFAQQGGWLATRDQVLRLDEGLCRGKFIPPFDPPSYEEDGQQSMNVEFWSGGYQQFTGIRNGCNMQRLLRFDPEHFSKHLIYHVANNKQKQLTYHRMLRADHLFAQLNTVRKKAIQAKRDSAVLGK